MSPTTTVEARRIAARGLNQPTLPEPVTGTRGVATWNIKLNRVAPNDPQRILQFHIAWPVGQLLHDVAASFFDGTLDDPQTKAAVVAAIKGLPRADEAVHLVIDRFHAGDPSGWRFNASLDYNVDDGLVYRIELTKERTLSVAEIPSVRRCIEHTANDTEKTETKGMVIARFDGDAAVEGILSIL